MNRTLVVRQAEMEAGVCLSERSLIDDALQEEERRLAERIAAMELIMVSITLHSCMRAIYSQSSFQAVASQKGLTCVRRAATSLPQQHIQTHHLSVIMSLGPAIPRRYVSMTCPNLFPFLLVDRCMLLSPVHRQFADLLLQCGSRSGTLGCRKSYKWARRPHPESNSQFESILPSQVSHFSTSWGLQ